MKRKVFPDLSGVFGNIIPPGEARKAAAHFKRLETDLAKIDNIESLKNYAEENAPSVISVQDAEIFFSAITDYMDREDVAFTNAQKVSVLEGILSAIGGIDNEGIEALGNMTRTFLESRRMALKTSDAPTLEYQ